MSLIRLEELRQAAAGEGLAILSALSAEEAETILREEASRLKAWQDSGCAGEMSYMKRPVELFTRLDNFLPGVRSVISFAAAYGGASEELPQGFGRIARYAWGEDYHTVLKNRLERLCAGLSKKRAFRYRLFSDAVPLLERALGRARSGGFIGKNTMLILPKAGSFFFTAELLSDAEIGVDGEPAMITKSRCGACTRCQRACPTKALEKAGSLDARRCISYLTIEKKGSLEEWERKAIGGWIFGCDICQEVCPYNRRPGELRALNEFEGEIRGGLALLEVLSIRSTAEFKRRFGNTALMRAGRAALLRNACCAAANTRCFELMDVLSELAANDSSVDVREHALWAMRELSGKGP